MGAREPDCQSSYPRKNMGWEAAMNLHAKPATVLTTLVIGRSGNLG